MQASIKAWPKLSTTEAFVATQVGKMIHNLNIRFSEPDPQGCRLPLRVLVSSSPADILIDIFTNSALVGQPSSSFFTDAGDRTQNLHLVNEVLKLCIMLLNQQMFRLFRPVPGLCDSHLYGFSRADLRPERKYRVVKFVDHDIIRRCCCKEHLFPKLHSHLCLFQRLNSSFSTLQRRFVMTAQF